MLFDILHEKNVIIDGKIITFKAGKFDTTDKDEIKALSECKGVTKPKAKSKSA